MSTTAALELFRLGKAREAEIACQARLAVSHHDVEALSLLAEIHQSTGRAASAADLLKQLTHFRPQDAAAQRRLATALLAAGRPAEAADALRTAIRIEPGSTRAHNNLGQALMQLSHWPEAIASYREALRLDPGYAIAHVNLGLALTQSGELNQAANSFERALAVTPQMVEAWLGRGAVLARQQQFAEALECFETAQRLRPGNAATLAQKAFMLLSLERPADALDCADLALQADNNCVQAHNIRAGALRRLGRCAAALDSLQRALAQDPGYVEAWCNHGMILHEMGDHEGAVQSYRRAVELDSDDIQARTRLLARRIPSVPVSEVQARAARRTFDAELLEFESWLGSKVLDAQGALTVAQQQFFYLSYEEESNRPLLERYRGACAARLAALEVAGCAPLRAPVAHAQSVQASRRFKLGFVSAHVHDHSVFHAILRGWLKYLDRERFELRLFSVGSKHDEATRHARESVDCFETGPKPTSEWIRSIRNYDLDAVIYPELGMNETTLALAAARLAQRQFAAWGHPETSGLPTIDGYLSADLFEPPQAQDHYSEPLVRLPNLGVHCEPYGVTPMDIDLSTLGIPTDGPVFICPGVPFKYRPQHDWILAEIARRLGRGTFVFFRHEAAELSRKLQERIAAAFRRAGVDPARHLLTIPWQPRAAFFALLRRADVYLDTIGFSGFNTMMQAVECKLPCVTHEGRFMRGRLGSAILRRVGLPELVGADHQRYIDLAVGLAEDPAHRARIRESLRLNAATAFEDVGAVDALARFLLESRESL
ncbi:MAG: tetratricopeptide repeat protein [Steroidobacteraceae bacterium]